MLLTMALGKILFLIFQSDYSDNSFKEIILSIAHGFRLDLSAAAYLMGVPILLLLLAFLINKNWAFKIVKYYICLEIVIYLCIVIGESLLYREWQTKLTVQALLHFLNPSEVFKTASWGMSLLFFVSVICLSVVLIYLLNKIIDWDKLQTNAVFKQRSISSFLGFILCNCFVVVFARGGFQEIPISSSDCYFSQKALLNDAATNPFWSLCHNCAEYYYHLRENPFKIMNDEEANKIVTELYHVEKDTTEIIISQQRPNIVFLIMESWSSNCVSSFGGDNFAPFMDSLSKQGVRFTNLYASAYVSDQGIPAVLSACI